MLRWQTGEGLHRQARGSHMWFKATAAGTGGRFSLMERTLPPGGRMPPAHRHTGNDEAYFVLQGEVRFHVAGEEFDGGPDTFVLVEAGEEHTFGNVSTDPARLLVIHAPALDAYFEELQALWATPDPPDRQAELDLMRRHGMEPA
ncbi:MAG TPA: cupin domain-containing protein [Acidimicrobiales bacterium]|nr:cupin domain-containing protein [Acidimicrobiales bacterium]